MKQEAKLNDPQRPFLTIGIFTYKRSKRLEFLLQKLSEQVGLCSYDWEILVSDNCSRDGTKELTAAFAKRLHNIRYFEQTENVGPDLNFLGLIEKTRGRYLWPLPDDDWVVDQHSVKKIVDYIKNSPVSPAFVSLNGKIGDIETHDVQSGSVLPITGPIIMIDGRDILAFRNDYILWGCAYLIYRCDTLSHPYVEQYKHTKYLSPLVLSYAACSQGPALLIGEPLIVYGKGDQNDWRLDGPRLICFDAIDLLQAAVKELNYPTVYLRNAISHRKLVMKYIMPSSFMVFQRYGVTWQRMAKYYGWSFVIRKVLLWFPIAIPHMLLYPYRKQIKEAVKRLRQYFCRGSN